MLVPTRQFDLEAMQILGGISGDPHVAISAFDDELEKIAFFGALARGVGSLAGGASGAYGALKSSLGGLAQGARKGTGVAAEALSGAASRLRGVPGNFADSMSTNYRAGRAGRTFDQQVGTDRLSRMIPEQGPAATVADNAGFSPLEAHKLRRLGLLPPANAPSQVPTSVRPSDQAFQSLPQVPTAQKPGVQVVDNRIANRAATPAPAPTPVATPTPAVAPTPVAAAADAPVPNRRRVRVVRRTQAPQAQPAPAPQAQPAAAPQAQGPATTQQAAAGDYFAQPDAPPAVQPDAAPAQGFNFGKATQDMKNWYAGLSNDQKAALMAGGFGVAGLGGLATGAIVD